MKRGPNGGKPMIVNNRIAGTRITVWDVLHYLENRVVPARDYRGHASVSDAQVDAVAKVYCGAPRGTERAVHQQIEARKARGNPPEITAKLARESNEVAGVADATSRDEDVGCPCM